MGEIANVINEKDDYEYFEGSYLPSEEDDATPRFQRYGSSSGVCCVPCYRRQLPGVMVFRRRDVLHPPRAHVVGCVGEGWPLICLTPKILALQCGSPSSLLFPWSLKSYKNIKVKNHTQP